MNEVPKIDVSAYSDYRDLFHDLFLYEKKINSTYSYEYCARKIGVTKSYFKLLFQKKNHASLDKVSTISKFFNLSTEEFQHVVFLYLKNVSKEEGLTDYFSEVLQNIINQKKIRSITPGDKPRIVSPTLSNWLVRIIHSMENFSGFKRDVNWIKKRIILQNDNGKLVEALNIFTDKETKRIDGKNKPGLKLKLDGHNTDNNIYKSYFSQAIDMLDNKSSDEPGHCHSICVSVDEKGAWEIIKIYQEAKEKAIALSRSIPNAESDKVLFVLNGAFTVASEKNADDLKK